MNVFHVSDKSHKKSTLNNLRVLLYNLVNIINNLPVQKLQQMGK